MTEWEEYKTIDWVEYEFIMSKPSWVFDTRLVCDINEIKNKINFWRIGKNFNSQK